MTESIFNSPLPTKAGDKHKWAQLYGSAAGLAIVEAAKASAAAERGPILLLANDTASMNRLEDELHFYASGSELPILTFPDQETLPYDRFSPHPDITSRRLEVLTRLPYLEQGIILSTLPTIMQRVPPCDYIERHAFSLAIGETLHRDKLRLRLEQSGYHSVSQVMEHGEYAFRGSIIDLFPMGAKTPYRIDLFDDEVETLSTFDQESQRSIEQVEEIKLLPAREFPTDENGVREFRTSWRIMFEGDPQENPIYRDISQGLTPAGIEYYLPLFFETTTLFEYLPDRHTIIYESETESVAEQFWKEIEERYEDQKLDRGRVVVAPEQLFIKSDQLFAKFKLSPAIQLNRFEIEAVTKRGSFNLGSRKPMQLGVQSRSTDPLKPLLNFIQTFSGRILLAVESNGRREALLEMLRPHSIHPHLVESWQQFIKDDSRLDEDGWSEGEASLVALHAVR